jgi:hypothetical protein
MDRLDHRRVGSSTRPSDDRRAGTNARHAVDSGIDAGPDRQGNRLWQLAAARVAKRPHNISTATVRPGCYNSNGGRSRGPLERTLISGRPHGSELAGGPATNVGRVYKMPHHSGRLQFTRRFTGLGGPPVYRNYVDLNSWYQITCWSEVSPCAPTAPALEMPCAGQTAPMVRIPPSPL